MSKRSGQVKKGDIESLKDSKISLQDAHKEFERQERATLQELKERIEKVIDGNPTLEQFKKQLLLDITSEGLRIQIVDEQNRPMFDTASDQLKPYTRDILREIGKTLNQVQNKITISGHTDAAQFAGGQKGFSNWELSGMRANAARRELIQGNMDENKVLRVVGMSSTVLFDRNDPLNPVNRRISIVVLNKRTEESYLREDNPEIQVDDGDKAAAGTAQALGAKP